MIQHAREEGDAELLAQLRAHAPATRFETAQAAPQVDRWRQNRGAAGDGQEQAPTPARNAPAA